MLDVLRELLTERRDTEVLALVAKLVVRNSELERRLMQMLSRGHKNEGVSSAQLKLFLDALAATGVDTGVAGKLIAATNYYWSTKRVHSERFAIRRSSRMLMVLSG